MKIPAHQGKLSKLQTRSVIQLLENVLHHRVPAIDMVASWSTREQSILLDFDGYLALRAIAGLLKGVDGWKTYPLQTLQTMVAHSLMESTGEPYTAVSLIKSKLNDGLGNHRVFVPFWGFHMDAAVSINFGTYTLQKLGDSGMQKQLLEPFAELRSDIERTQSLEELSSFKASLQHMRNIPVLSIDYFGSADGASDFVSSIAEHIAEALQFITGYFQRREDIKIIEHRGRYFSRYSTMMPVISRNVESNELLAVNVRNIRELEYPFTLKIENFQTLLDAGFDTILPLFASASRTGTNVDALLLRAIQLFSDAERAVSHRQAVIAYIGACDVLFGKKNQSTLYTCTGMAEATGANFSESLRLAKSLYDDRSKAIHSGLNPIDVESARIFARQSIIYVLQHKGTLQKQKDIYDWLTPLTRRKKSLPSSLRSKSSDSLRHLVRGLCKLWRCTL